MTMFPSSPSLLFHFSLLHSCAQLWHTDVIWRSRSHFWLVTFSRALFDYLFIDKHAMVIQILPLWKMKTVDFFVFLGIFLGVSHSVFHTLYYFQLGSKDDEDLPSPRKTWRCTRTDSVENQLHFSPSIRYEY